MQLKFIPLCISLMLLMPHNSWSAVTAEGRASVTTDVSVDRINSLKQFAKQNGYSTQYGFFVDLSVFSGKKRFHAIDLQQENTVHSGLVTHGHCQENKKAVRFSNQKGSNCSSEGKYRIGKSYNGNFGLAFKLHGLNATNTNAFKRYIVMHSHRCVSDQTLPHEICESEGCPTVSPAMLQKLKQLIMKEQKPILMWIYK